MSLSPRRGSGSGRQVLTIVIKVGTTSIVHEKTHFPLLSNLSSLVETIIELKTLGHRVVLVTSGAIGAGLRRLNLEKRPKHLPQIQVSLISYIITRILMLKPYLQLLIQLPVFLFSNKTINIIHLGCSCSRTRKINVFI